MASASRCATSRCRCRWARRSPCSAPTAPARRRCCGCSRGCRGPTAGRPASRTRTPREAPSLRGHVGLLGHDLLLDQDLSASQNLRFHARLHGVERRAARELLARMGLRARANEPLRSLSRGMRQRVAAPPLCAARPRVAAARRAARESRSRGGRGRRAADRPGRRPDRGANRARACSSATIRRPPSQADLVLGLRAGRAVIAAPRTRLAATRSRLYR